MKDTRFTFQFTSSRILACHYALIALLSLMLSATLTSCSKDGDVLAPETKYATTAYGSGSSATSDFYYPHHKGYTIGFANTLRTYLTDTTYQDSSLGYDTVKTLGFQGTYVNGDSLFAVSIKYQVSSYYSGHASTTLYCAPPSGSFAGAFCNANASIASKQSLGTAPVTAADLTLSPLYGRLHMVTDSGYPTWQIDTLYFTGSNDTVTVWSYASGSWSNQAQIFPGKVTSFQTWSSIPGSSTAISTLEASSLSLTEAGNAYTAMQVERTNSNYSIPMQEDLFYGSGIGVLKQVNTFWMTSDGVQSKKLTLTREAGVVVYDAEEGT